MKTLTLMMIATMTVMAGATIAPALPAIENAFLHTPHVNFLTKLLLSATALFTAISAPVAGVMADRYGRRPIVLTAILLYGIAGSAGLYLDSMNTLLISRALLGLSVGALMTMATTLVADYFQGEKRTKMMGLKGGAASFGGVVFLSLGGVLAEAGWRFPFYIYLFSFLVLPIAFYAITEPKKSSQETKFALKKAIEAQKTLAPIYFIAALTMMLFYMIPTQLSFFLKERLNASSALTGQMISVSAVLGGLVASNYQRFLKFFSHKVIILLSWMAMGISFSTLSHAGDLLQVTISMIMLGISYGLFMPSFNLMIAEKSQLEVRGLNLGLLTSFIFIGQFLSPFYIEFINSLFPGATFMASSSLIMLLTIIALGRGLYLELGKFDKKVSTTEVYIKSCDCMNN